MTTTTISDTDLWYLAGLWDAEGSFSIQVNVRQGSKVKGVHFAPRMTMSLRYGTQVLEEYRTAFGGSIYEYSDGMHRWSLSGVPNLSEAARTLCPHLHIKREICRRFIEALDLWPRERNNLGGERAWSEERALGVAEIALTLNPASSRRSNKTLDYLDEIKAIYATT